MNSSKDALEIKAYDPSLAQVFEGFRAQALAEGNDSLIPEKFNPQTLRGNTLLCFYEGVLISVSAAEASDYTGDPEVACRICRYHVLKEYRNKFLFCGFQMLRQHCEWADNNGYKVVYFTQNNQNKPLNALYQKKRKYTLGADNSWFEDPFFQSFNLEQKMLFQVSEKSSLMQFVYSRKNPADFSWQPPKGIQWTEASVEI